MGERDKLRGGGLSLSLPSLPPSPPPPHSLLASCPPPPPFISPPTKHPPTTLPCFCRQRPHPAVAVPAGAADRPQLPDLHLLDGRRLGVQAVRPGRGGPALGHPQEQAQDELREAVQGPALLLRQAHHPQDGRQEVRVPLHAGPGEDAGPHPRGALPGLRRHPAG